MLILTRRIGETLIIGENIQVKVLDIWGKQISLGIEAPKNVAIHRLELYERLQQEKEDLWEGWDTRA